MVATAAATQSGTPPDGPDASIEPYTNSTPQARAHLALARDLEAIFTDDSLSRRDATFDAAARALAARRTLAAERLSNENATSQLAAQQTKLRGARALLTAAEADRNDRSGSLARTATLTELGIKVQAARLQTDTEPRDPTDVTLPDTTMPEHDAPSAAAFAILEAQNVEVTSDEAADIHALDELPESTRRELTDVLDAYLGYYRTTQAATWPNARGVQAAQLQLLQEATDLETALETTDDSRSGGAVSNARADSGVNISGVVSIDLARDNNTYTQDYHLQIDAGGGDTYNNNAGGANVSGNGTDAAALLDFGGTDTYNGRNGGGRYVVTKESPSVPAQRVSLPKKGEAAGFLLDAGTSDDTYNATAHGSNGGGRRGVGFLVDAGGTDIYNGSGKGTNGAAYKKATGFLMDAGTGSDTYAAGDSGVSNAGTNGGRGFLFDVGGNDTYDGSNGGAHRKIVGTGLPIPCQYDLVCKILPGRVPHSRKLPQSGGFLVDGAGTDIYEGANGGAGIRSAGFLLDAGTSNDTYDGKNGGATRRGATGFLLDLGGNDTYLATSGAQNGGGHVNGFGFLMDGGTGDDTYDATNGDGTHHWSRQDLPPGSHGTNGGGWQSGRGFLADAGGNDEYIAGSVAVNGGATRGREPGPGGGGLPSRKASGFLLNVAGNDTYTAVQAAVNGGADHAVGLLYDTGGTDRYSDYFQRCRDCTDVPKGTIGGQIDLGSGQDGSDSQEISTEVLVVDDNAETAAADCQDAAYTSIQTAVNDATYGDTVRVCAGTYPGSVILNTTNVTLRAATPGHVVLDGNDSRRFGVLLKAGQTAVTGFRATGFAGRGGTAFVALGPQTSVSDTVITDSRLGVLVMGLYAGSFLAETPVGDGDEATVITNNTVRNMSGGISVMGTGNVRITDNTIQETARGILLRSAAQIRVSNNRLTAGSLSTARNQRGLASLRSSDVTITDNTVTGFIRPENQARPSAAIATGIGIEIRYPRDNGGETTHTLRNNTMANSTYNLHVTSGKSGYQHLDIDPTNTVNGKPVLYLVGATNLVIGSPGPGGQPVDTPAGMTPNQSNRPSLEALTTPGYVACVSCTNVTIRDLELKHNGQGVLIAKSSGMHVDNVTVHDTLQGVSVEGSPSNTRVTDSTIRDVFQGIVVRHNCASREDLRVRSPLGMLTGGNTETCVTPSVVLADNTIRHPRLFVKKWGNNRVGTGIVVRGVGVTVRQNTITDGYRRGILVQGRLFRRNQQSSHTDTDAATDPIANSTVIDNTISNFSIGVSVKRSRGTSVISNTISDTGLGFFTFGLNSGTYRDNVVTNTTTGMLLHWSVNGITARNNSFRNVNWGLDGQFMWQRTALSHDFGTTNTVNGDRILWLNDAVERTIDAADANMVVCVHCVNVTIEDMRVSDNGHGVVLWESTGSRVQNVTAEDNLKTGVLVRGGQNNTVRESTVIDSTFPIVAVPGVDETRRIRPDGGRYLPFQIPRSDRFPRDPLGSVRIINNRVTVDDAKWPVSRGAAVASPLVWGHFGIMLWHPSAATIRGNTVIDNRWGIFLWGGQISDIRILNNRITTPRKEHGIDRFGSQTGIWEHSIGVRVKTKASDTSTSSLTISNNMLTTGTQGRGIALRPRKGVFPPTNVVNNSIQGYKIGLAVSKRSNTTSVSIRQNRFVGTKAASVAVRGSPAGESVEIHQNLLNPLRFGYGVKYSRGGGGGHMSSGGSDGGHSAGHQSVDATCNRWAAPNGPRSQRITLLDPVTGEPADGNGSAVSRGQMDDVSNVHFHPWLGNSPGRTCDKAIVGTATPTPTPGPTRTPWPTIGAGAGDGPGQGDGPGPGDGDGPGPGQATAEDGGEGASTATVRVPATATPTATPPPTATPEIVPGFGIAVWLVALLGLVSVLAARRRD